MGKQLLSALSAKVDKLQELHNNESQQLREVARQAEQAERKANSNAQDLANKLDKGHLKLQTLVSEMSARIKSAEQARSDETERQRMLLDEVNSMRYKLESFSLQASEVGSEFKNRSREWDIDAQRGADAIRAVREHDHALETLHHSIDATQEAVSKKVETSIMEMRLRIDSEGRARFQFEQGMRELYSEVRKVMSNQDRDVNSRMETFKQQITQAFDRERQEREKGLGITSEQMRMLEKATREALQMAVDKMASQVANVDDVVTQERTSRGKFEGALRTEVEEAFKLIQTAVVKKFDEMQTSQTESKHAIANAIKTLKESLLLVERTADQKLLSIEEVLRAEIRSRMETDRALSDVKTELETKADDFEKKASEAITEAVQEARTNTLKIEEDLKRTAEQLIIAKTRSLEDVENQLSNVRKRVKESEVETDTKLRQLQLAAEQVGHNAHTALETMEARMETKFTGVSTEIESVSGKIKEVEALCGKVKVDMDDRLNFRAQQIDSALDAFKVEIDQRSTKKDAADAEKRFEAQVGSIQSSISNLHTSIQTIRDDVDLKSSKKEIDESESRSKTQLAALNARFVDMDTNFLNIREEFASKAAKKDVEEMDSNLKTIIVNLQVKDVAIEELFEKLQEDVNERINKKQLNDLEDRMRNYILNLETKDLEFDQSISGIKESLSLCPARAELSEAEKKIMTWVFKTLTATFYL